MNPLTDLAAAIVAPVVSIFTKKTERKQSQDRIKGAIAQAKTEGKNTITVVDGDWEAAKAQREGESWKDEYVTLVITAPILLVIVGCVVTAFTGDARLLDGAVAGIDALNAAGVPMGTLMTATVYAALSLKLWRSI